MGTADKGEPVITRHRGLAAGRPPPRPRSHLVVEVHVVPVLFHPLFHLVLALPLLTLLALGLRQPQPAERPDLLVTVAFEALLLEHVVETALMTRLLTLRLVPLLPRCEQQRRPFLERLVDLAA